MVTGKKAVQVLVIEDDESWRRNIEEYLGHEGKGYSVTCVGSREDAIAELKVRQFALVVIDLKLPGSPPDSEPGFEHGVAVIKHVVNLASRPEVLIITGYSQLPVEAARIVGLHGLEVATKDPESLNAALERVCQRIQVRSVEIVMKFGGTSVGSTEQIDAVAGIVRQYLQGSLIPCVVVVSAMSSVTDTLLDCFKQVSKVEKQEYGKEICAVQETLEELKTRHADAANHLVTTIELRDEYIAYLEEAFEDLFQMYQGVAKLQEDSLRAQDRISGYGERLSARLLAATLRSRGIESIAVDATDIIITDDVFGSASPLFKETNERTERVLVPLLEQDIVPVVTGFIASSLSGAPTTLGRGGSDFTSTILGAALNVKEVWIWTDVNGVMDVDPSLVEDAITIKRMSYEKAAELTYHGAKVLHAKALGPVIEKRIPIRILNTFAPKEEGTWIGPIGVEKEYEGNVLISSSGLGLVTIRSDLDQSWTPAIGARALTALDRDDVEVLEYCQSFSRRTMSITLRKTDTKRAVNTLKREFKDNGTHPVKEIESHEGVAAVSIINGHHAYPDLAGRILAELGANGIEVLSVIEVPTESSFSFLVDQSKLKEAVQGAHDAMISARREVGP